MWKGVFPAVTTQMKKDESLDLDATAKHIEVLLDSGVDGIIMLGSLGENATLAPQEKRDVVRSAIEAVRGRVPVLSGVVETSTAASVQYVRDMEKLGANGVMLLPAMIYKADAAETMQHYRTVAKATSMPIIVYNNPLAYTVDITPTMFAQLADVKNFVALKESSGDVRRVTDLRNTVGDRYQIFCGVDDLIVESAVLGIDGWIMGMGLAFPKENQKLWNLLVAGDYARAREMYRWFTPLMHLDTPIKFVQYIKLAIQETGLGAEWVRAPRRVLEGAERKQILEIIHRGIENRPKL